MSEPVDVKKLVDVSPTTLVKTSSSTFKGLMVILGVVAILFCVYFTVSRLFKKPIPNQAISVQSGGQVVIHNEPKKKSWWIPAPFVEVYTFVQTNDEQGLGGRFGGRWEF